MAQRFPILIPELSGPEPPPDGDATKHYVTVRADEDWIVSYGIHEERGRPVIGELRVFPAGRIYGVEQAPKGGLTSKQLRRFRLGDIVRFAGEISAALRELGIHPPIERPPERKSPAGRKPLPDENLARVARVYEEATTKRRPPIVAVQKRFRLSRDLAKSRIDVARRRGFLDKAGRRGAAGGQMTDKARAVLKAAKRKKGRKKK